MNTIKVRAIIFRAFFIPLLAACVFPMSGPNAAMAADSIPIGKITPDSSKMWSPGKLAVDSQGSIYVVDSYKNCVRQFDGKGNYAGQIRVKRPSAVAASSGKVYVGSHQDYSAAIYKSGEITGYLGAGKNEFLSISDISIDESTGEVYVADAKAGVIKVYYGSGVPKTVFSGLRLPTAVSAAGAGVYVLDAPVIPCAAPAGTDSSIQSPQANSECTGLRIALLDKNGSIVKSITESGAENMIRPIAIAVDTLENIYVADASRKAILAYDRLGAFIGAMTSSLDDLRIPASLASHDGSLFVSASETHSIVKIGLSGKNQEGSSGSLEFKSKTGATASPAALGY